MIFVYNRELEQVATLDVDYTFKEEINKLNELEFSASVELEKNFRVVVDVDKKKYEFIIVDIEYSRIDDHEFNYYCQDSIIELNGYVIQEERPTESLSVTLERILSSTNWTYQVIGYDTTVKKKVNMYRVSRLEAIKETLSIFNVEWHTEISWAKDKIIERKLVIQKQGKESNARLEFGKNINKFERKILSEPIITALIGLGKGEEKFDETGQATGGYGRRITFSNVNNGSWYVGNDEAKEKYGILRNGVKQHYFNFVIFPDITDENELLQATKEELKNVSRINAEYSIDISNLDIDVRKGDTIVAIDEVINFRDYMRIIAVEKTRFTTKLLVGTKLSQFSYSSTKRMENIQKLINSEVSTVFQATRDMINNHYINEDGYTYNLNIDNEYGVPAGIYSFDKPINESPTKMVYMGAGKVLIADGKTTDGAWNFRTAITPEGIIGDEIVTGTVTANKLSSDVGQILDISSNEAIRNLVTNSEYNENQELINQRFSEVMQTGNNLEISISEIISKVNENKALTDNEFDFIKTYFNFASDGLEIGKTSSEMTLKLLNDRISFLDNGNEVAYISDNKLEIFDGNFMNSLGLGRFEFVPRESGNLSFRLKRN